MSLAIDKPLRIAREELLPQLQLVLSSFFGGEARIRSFRRRRSNYCSSFTIENLDVELDPPGTLRLIVKDLSPSSLLSAAREVRPDFLYNPRREIVTYRSVLNPLQFGTATCYGALEQPESERYWLFLERVQGVLLWQVGRFEQWERAAGWLAAFHFHFSGIMQCKATPELFLRYDSDHCLRWIERAAQFVTRANGGLSAASAGRFGRLVKQYHRVADRLSLTAHTVIHGEFYPSNVILRGGARGTQLCPIDWEVTAVGPGCIDLAALVSGAWSEEQKSRLVAAYHRVLVGLDANAPALEELMELVDYAQLHLAIQWLGWATDWSPPKTHERNWLDEAIRLATGLKLI